MSNICEVVRGGRIFRRGKHVLTAAPLTATAVVALTSMSGTYAHATCSPANLGTPGNDTIICNIANDPAGADVFAAGGNDTITIDGVTAGDVSGAADNDTILLTNGATATVVFGAGGSDIITLDGATVSGGIVGGDGVDVINLVNGVVDVVDWGDGNEGVVLDLTNVTVTNIVAGLGADNFTLNAGMIGGNVLLGAAPDSFDGGNVFTLNNGAIGGDLVGASDRDLINLFGGSVAGGVMAGDGIDTIILDGATVLGIDGGDGVDTININSGTVTGSVDWGAGDETASLDLSGASIFEIFAGEGSDDFTLTGGTVGRDLSLGANSGSTDGGNIFTLDGGTVTRNVLGAADGDVFNLNSGSVGGEVLGFGGTDTFNLDGATVLGIDGGDGVDTINLNSGTVTGTVDWGGGDETVSLDLSGVTVNDVSAGLGVDDFTLTAGTVGRDFFLGANSGSLDGGNTFTLDGGTIGRNLRGAGDADTINLNSGTVTGWVFGNGGADTINLDGATATRILGGDGVDVINLNTGTVTERVDWGGGDETVVLDLTNVSVAEIRAGDGSDDFTLNAGVVTRDVFLGATTATADGGNTFTLDGGDIGRNLQGAADADIINLNSGTVTGWVLGNGGADTISIDGATATRILGGDGVDVINLNAGTITERVDWGGGDETAVLDLTNVSVVEIRAGEGSDDFTLNAGVITGDVFLGATTTTADGGNTFTLNGGTISNNLSGAAGEDLFMLNGGTVGNEVNGHDGDDEVIISDGFTITGTVNGGDNDANGDIIALNTVAGRTFGGASNFENLRKENTGVLTLTGTQTYVGFTQIDAGTLDVDGTLRTATLTMTAGGTTLEVDGTVEGTTAGSQTDFTGSSGVDTVMVNAGGTLLATGDLGGDNDAVTLSGTLDTGAGTFDLGSGDDMLTLNDGGSFVGMVDGGSGRDTIAINTVAGRSFGGSTNFEDLQKDGAGTLTLTGTQTYTGSTTITGGTLDVDGTLQTAMLTMTAGGTTLNVDGTVEGATAGSQTNFTGSAGVDTVAVNSGATLRATGDLGADDDVVTLDGALDAGSGTFSLGTGDDLVTLNDSASITGELDGGGNTAAGDQFVANVSSDRSLDVGQIVNFETLQKNGAGTLTLTGNQEFANDVSLNAGTLTNDGNLNTAALVMGNGTTLNAQGEFGAMTVTMGDGTTLNVGGVLDDGSGGQSALTGSAGDNTVNVTGSLFAQGDLGDGSDTLALAGLLNTGGGTLSLGAGADSFSIMDGVSLAGMVDGGAGTDIFNATINSTVSIDNVTGFETLNKSGSGTLNLSGAALTGYSTVNLNGGVLGTDDAFSVAGNMNIAAGGTFLNQVAGATILNVAGALSNAGTINFQDGATGDMITVGGNYSGGGSLLFDVDFAADTADTLIVAGDVTAGGTTISAADISSGSASGNDIVLVDVSGATGTGDFQLAGGSVTSGSNTYLLNQVGSQWVLQLGLLPQNLLYEVYPRNLQILNELPMLRERMQNRAWLAGGDSSVADAGVWMRVSGGWHELDPRFSTFAQDLGTSNIDYDITTTKYELGLDAVLVEETLGHLVGGARLFYGNADLSGTSPIASGNIDTDALGVGVSLTWYANSGFYADAQAQYVNFESDLSTSVGSFHGSNDGRGRAASMEIGQKFDLSDTFTITPEMQYTFSEVKFDAFTAQTGESVFLEDGKTSEVRLGATFEYNSHKTLSGAGEANNRFYLSTNLFHSFDTSTEVVAAEDSLLNDVRPWRGEIGVGGSREWVGKKGTRSALFAEVSVGSELGSDFSSGRSLGGRLGFTFEF